jgi:hypothetical protein
MDRQKACAFPSLEMPFGGSKIPLQAGGGERQNQGLCRASVLKVCKVDSFIRRNATIGRYKSSLSRPFNYIVDIYFAKFRQPSRCIFKNAGLQFCFLFFGIFG